LSILAPLLGGAFGVIVGAASTQNATVAALLGAFFALLGWALTGFRTGAAETAKQNQTPSRPQRPSVPTQPAKLPSSELGTPEPVASPEATSPEGDRKWFWFKVKACLLIGAALVAFNYKRCTEGPDERLAKDKYLTERMKSISGEEAYTDCIKDGASESECRESARRARELAEKKANTIFGR
jgi:hypothetical protein